MTIPKINTSVERIFSITNVLWSDKKNRFIMDITRLIIIVKPHFKNVSCTVFHIFLLEHPKLLYFINSSEEYKKLKSEGIQSKQPSSKSESKRLKKS